MKKINVILGKRGGKRMNEEYTITLTLEELIELTHTLNDVEKIMRVKKRTTYANRLSALARKIYAQFKGK